MTGIPWWLFWLLLGFSLGGISAVVFAVALGLAADEQDTEAEVSAEVERIQRIRDREGSGLVREETRGLDPRKPRVRR